MDLESLVTDALVSEEKEEEFSSFYDLLQTSASNEESLAAGRAAERALFEGEDDPSAVRRLVTPAAICYTKIATLRYASSRAAGTAIFVLLLDWLESKKEEDRTALLNYLRSTNNYLENRMIVSSETRLISFLEDLWGEESVQKISKFSKTRPETVRKWLLGSSPSSENSSILSHLATIAYRAHVDLGMEYSDIPAWMEEDKKELGGKSMLAIFEETRSFWSIPPAIREMLKEKGAEL